MTEKILNFSNPQYQFEQDEHEITETISNFIKAGKYILGEAVEEFEDKFSNLIGTKFAVGTSSGTDSIILALRVLGLEIGDEVIVPSLTATATVAAICMVGAVPKFIDINPKTYCLDEEKIQPLITKRTKAILVVHLYGMPANMVEIKKISKKHGLFLIEDCAQALGSKINDKFVGSIGDVGCHSFYPTKNLSTIGDAGAITTNSLNLYKKLVKLRQYGWNEKRESVAISGVYRMDALHAKILNLQLDKLPERLNQRQQMANKYLTNLNNLPIVLPFCNQENIRHTYHLFVIQFDKRKEIKEYLERNSVFPGIHYLKPVHKQIAFKHYSKNCNLDVTNKVVKNILSLPLYIGLKDKEIEHICQTINLFYDK